MQHFHQTMWNSSQCTRLTNQLSNNFDIPDLPVDIGALDVVNVDVGVQTITFQAGVISLLGCRHCSPPQAQLLLKMYKMDGVTAL